jgi:hypothetical protein
MSSKLHTVSALNPVAQFPSCLDKRLDGPQKYFSTKYSSELCAGNCASTFRSVLVDTFSEAGDIVHFLSCSTFAITYQIHNVSSNTKRSSLVSMQSIRHYTE